MHQNKNNQIWIGLDLDRDTREVVGFAVGDRNRAMARELWNSWTPVYRQCAVSYTNLWEVYQKVFPSTRLKQVGQETGKTSPVERFNNTLRQRISQLVRKTLSFSKKIRKSHGIDFDFSSSL